MPAVIIPLIIVFRSTARPTAVVALAVVAATFAVIDAGFTPAVPRFAGSMKSTSALAMIALTRSLRTLVCAEMLGKRTSSLVSTLMHANFVKSSVAVENVPLLTGLG